MPAVWKYPLQDDADAQVVAMPPSARIVRVGWQQSEFGVGPMLWVEVDNTRAETDLRRFRIIATGHPYGFGVWVGMFEAPTVHVLHVIEVTP